MCRVGHHTIHTVHDYMQSDRLSRKPGNVGEFDRCQGNVRDFTKNEENVRELLGKQSCRGKVA